MPHFTVEIEMGNEAMNTCDDLARALRDLADRLASGVREGGVRDENGNTVGHWSVS